MFSFLLSLASCHLYLHNEEKSFLSWMRSNNKFYTGDEYFLRLGIYMANFRYVKEHNIAHKSFRVGLNKFASYTPAEYKSILGITTRNIKLHKSSKSFKKLDIESLDWRDKGVINSVQDQANCAAGYAFAAMQSIEAAIAIKNGNLLKLSEQEQIDCNSWCSGCHGGLSSDIYLYTLNFLNGSFALDSDYPYTGAQGKCLFEEKQHPAKITNYGNVNTFDEDDLEAKVQVGPVSCNIDATTSAFQLYSGGIFDDESCSETVLNHGCCCIGFGSENGVKYWLVRNSFGTLWGEGGYIRMIRKNNQCGIASFASIPYA